MSKFYKEIMARRTAVQQRPASHTLLRKILTFSNGCILFIIESYYTKLGGFCESWCALSDYAQK